MIMTYDRLMTQLQMNHNINSTILHELLNAVNLRYVHWRSALGTYNSFRTNPSVRCERNPAHIVNFLCPFKPITDRPTPE